MSVRVRAGTVLSPCPGLVGTMEHDEVGPAVATVALAVDGPLGYGAREHGAGVAQLGEHLMQALLERFGHA